MKRKLNTLSLIRSDQRAKKAHQRKLHQFLFCVTAVISIVFLSMIFSDPTSAVGISGLASMALIGSIGDLTDQYTTGSNIAAKIYPVKNIKRSTAVFAATIEGNSLIRLNSGR